MKNLGKILLVIALCFLGMQLSAQRLGIKGGLSSTNVVVEDNDGTYSDDFEALTGYHAALMFDYRFTPLISVELGLMATTRGFSSSEEEAGASVDIKWSAYYAEVPLAIKVAPEIQEDLRVFATAGPFVGFGVYGTVESTVKFMGQSRTEEEDIEWGSDAEEDDLQRLDYGVVFGAGVEYKSFMLGATYDLGLANISASTENDLSINNRGWKISLGYWIGR